MCGAPGRPIVPSRGLRVYYAPMPLPIALPAAAAALGAWAYGTYEPNSPLFGRAVGRGPTRDRVAYLTFDDGPNAGATGAILAAHLPCAARLSQPVRRCRHSPSRLYRVRMDVRRVGLGPPCFGRGDPSPRAP